MQTAIVMLIVALAVLFVARRVWTSFRKSKPGASGGCANCDAAAPDPKDWAR